MLSTVGTSKHERLKVTEGVWAHPGATAGRIERPLTPPNLHLLWPEKAFHMRKETSKKKSVKKSSCLHLQ